MKILLKNIYRLATMNDNNEILNNIDILIINNKIDRISKNTANDKYLPD